MAGNAIVTEVRPKARLATLAEIRRDLLPLWLNPAPTNATLRCWFKAERVQCLKSNPKSKRGGGPVYYLIADVEKCFRARIKRATTAMLIGTSFRYGHGDVTL